MPSKEKLESDSGSENKHIGGGGVLTFKSAEITTPGGESVEEKFNFSGWEPVRTRGKKVSGDDRNHKGGNYKKE